jgi:uncharacterized membrane protein (DUF4010 family)
VAANAVQFPRVLLLVYLIDPDLGVQLMLPCMAASAAGIAGGWMAARRLEKDTPATELGVDNPFALTPAFKFAAFFVAVLFVLRVAEASLGASGVYLTSVLAGAANVSTVALSVAGLVSAGDLEAAAAGLAVLLAVGANALTKWLVALVNGTRQLALWLGGGLAAMLIVGFTLAWLT